MAGGTTYQTADSAAAFTVTPSPADSARKTEVPDTADSAAHFSADMQKTDTLWTNPLSAFFPDEARQPEFPALRTLPDGTSLDGYRTAVGAAEVFGSETTRSYPETGGENKPDSLTADIPFQGFVLLLAAVYGMLLYRNLGDVRLLLVRISREKSAEHTSEEQGSVGFSHFLNVALVLGIFFTGIAAVRFYDQLSPVIPQSPLSHGAALLLSLVISAAVLIVFLYDLGMLRLAGAVTLSGPFVTQLVYLKRTYTALEVITLSPLLLLFILSPGTGSNIWLWALVAGLLITSLLYLRETLNLFISKKVSILHWFLYLCAVEIFPISLLWLLAVRQ